MTSGVAVNDQCVELYTALKLGRDSFGKVTYKYIVFNLSKDLKEIVVEVNKGSVEKQSEKEDEDEDEEIWKQEYDEFVNVELPEDQCRWAIYDFKFKKEGGTRQKLVFISWVPEIAKIKQKMLFASSRDALKRTLDGIGVEIQATDEAEVAYEAVLGKANQTFR